MGKIRTRILGLEEIEEKQKKEQKERAAQKKVNKPKIEEKKEEKKPEEKQKEVKTTSVKEEKGVKRAVLKQRGKRYIEAKKKIEKNKRYTLEAAVGLLKKIKYTNFDESVELHLNVDKTGLKGEVEMPYSIGKTVRVVVVDDKILAQIEKGQLDFDILVTHPSYMPKLAKFAKILGPKGLMPNPKAGTISPNPEEVAKKFQKGTLRWKTEPKFPLIHQLIGKLSSKDEEIIANVKAFLRSVGRTHIQKVFIKTTMSPALQLDIEKIGNNSY